MTDGEDSTALIKAKESQEKEGMGQTNVPYTIHTFGYGSGHDVDTCRELSAMGNGTYSYVENTYELGSAMGHVLGGLTSVIAQTITVKIEPQEGTRIKRIDTPYHTTIAPDGSYTVDITDIYHGERRDIMVMLSVGPVTIPTSGSSIVNVTTTYKLCPVFDVLHTSLNSIMIVRTEELAAMNVLLSIPEIDVELNRLRCLHAMESARSSAENGDFKKGECDLRKSMAEMRESPEYVNVLEGCLDSLHTTSGRAHIVDRELNVSHQRSTRTGVSMYSTPSQLRGGTGGTQVPPYPPPSIGGTGKP
jgi:hypothetical protein